MFKLINLIKNQMNNENMSPMPTVKEGVSPTPPKVKEMDFPDALREVIAGKKITKLEWCNKEIYGEMKDERLVLWKGDGKYYHWILSQQDVEGLDWVVMG